MELGGSNAAEQKSEQREAEGLQEEKDREESEERRGRKGAWSGLDELGTVLGCRKRGGVFWRMEGELSLGGVAREPSSR